jgi:hypothetical protein
MLLDLKSNNVNKEFFMKRKALQLFTYCLLAFLVVCSCDFRTDEERFQTEIRLFIMEHIENPSHYQPLAFQRIDNGFLSADDGLATSIMAVQDTVRTKLNFASAFFNPEQGSAIHQFLAAIDNFEFELIDELIFESVTMDKQIEKPLKQADINLWNSYRAQQQIFNDQISILNQQLKTYNLSVFHIDLSGESTVHYYHEYELNAQHLASVFELSTADLEMLSFKDIL